MKMKKGHKQLLRVIQLIVPLLACLLTSCQNTIVEQSQPLESEILFIDDPFESGTNSNTEILGWLSHGPESPVLDSNGLRVPYEYNGGSFSLEYHVCATGSAKNVGFLLFLDGIPQPYRVNGQSNEDYMHTFELEEDDQTYPFSFVFTPVKGKAGETLKLKVYSIYYAQFQPDMVTSSSYGLYHDTVEMTLEIIFNTDTDTNVSEADVSIVEALTSISITSENMTNEFISKRIENGFEANDQSMKDRLEDMVFSFIDYDGKYILDNLKISGQDKIHITYQMVGKPGATYRLSVFGNHRPMTDGETVAWTVTLSKGKIASFEADIKVAELGDFTTFYVFACPIQEDNSSSLLGTKTNSILLYKEVSK